MKLNKNTVISVVALLICGVAGAQNLLIETPNNSLVLSASNGEELKQLYYGERLNASEFENVCAVENGQVVYPAYGLRCAGDYALSVAHSDGNMTTQLVVNSVETNTDATGKITKIVLKDKVYPFHVAVYYKAYNDVDVISTWTEITNNEKKKVLLTKFASGFMPIRRGDVWLSHLYGSRINEGKVAEEPLTPGVKVVENREGVRTTHTSHPEVMFSLDGKAKENSGRVIGAALCYSGNYKLMVNTSDSEYHTFIAGINEDNSFYNLAKDETLTTPELAFTYSNEGLSGSSRNFHKWARKYKIAHGDKLRKVLLNSWEGVRFKINEPCMKQMMADIAEMGGELFVMDDGWFGTKYPRKNNAAGLGDWIVDTEKLPSGINGLLESAKENGIKFGIWIEPEMSNTTSVLYEKHPEWAIKAPQRDLVLGRGGTQVVLDLANPKVQDAMFNMVDTLMTKYPAIDYIKWDANMSITNHGSNYLTADNQSHLFIDYQKGLENVCKRIRAKYPDLTMQACASGGARVNYGVMPYFDEFWVSDNTDALQRIYMQWGTSYFYPAIAMASHISAVPNNHTHRTIPIKYRIDVAMSGRLGVELHPKNMSDEEKAQCKIGIDEYKKYVRPVAQFGDIYRLQSPYDKKGVASLMYVTEDKAKAVFYWWKLEEFCNQHLPRVPFAGLDSKKMYKVHELNRIDKVPLSFEGKSFSGEYLMSNGLEIPYEHNVDRNKRSDFASRVLYLTAE